MNLSEFVPPFFIFILGLCIGSFLNVCIYRIPLGKSILFPGSACPQCGRTLTWIENIPIVSYVFLGGRCKGCRTRIPFRYPIVELASGMAAVSLYGRFGLSLEFLYYFLFASILLVISFIDLDHKIIPDTLSLSGLLIGLAASHFVQDHSLVRAFFGILLGGGILFVVAWGYYLAARREGLGGGDIKLLAMIGAFLGWEAIPIVLFLSALTGSIVGLILVFWKGAGRHTEIPYGPFLSLGSVIYLFFPGVNSFLFSMLS